jgi:hypothetical protein
MYSQATVSRASTSWSGLSLTASPGKRGALSMMVAVRKVIGGDLRGAWSSASCAFRDRVAEKVPREAEGRGGRGAEP